MTATTTPETSAAGVLEVLPDAYRQAVMQELSGLAGEEGLLATLEQALHDTYTAYTSANHTDRAECAADLAVVAAALSVVATTT